MIFQHEYRLWCVFFINSTLSPSSLALTSGKCMDLSAAVVAVFLFFAIKIHSLSAAVVAAAAASAS